MIDGMLHQNVADAHNALDDGFGGYSRGLWRCFFGLFAFGRLANDVASWLEAFCKLKKALTSPEALSFLVSHLVSSCASFVMSFSASSA